MRCRSVGTHTCSLYFILYTVLLSYCCSVGTHTCSPPPQSAIVCVMHADEGWTYIDALYFGFVSFSTIGFGDYNFSYQTTGNAPPRLIASTRLAYCLPLDAVVRGRRVVHVVVQSAIGSASLRSCGRLDILGCSLICGGVGRR